MAEQTDEKKPWTAEDAAAKGWADPLIYGRSLANAMRESVVDFLDPATGRRDCLTRSVFDASQRKGSLEVLGVFTLGAS